MRKQVVREAVCSSTMSRKERRVLRNENLQDEEVWNDWMEEGKEV